MLACELWPPGGAWSMGPQKRGETAKPRIYPDLGSFVRVSYGIVCYWYRREGTWLLRRRSERIAWAVRRGERYRA